MKAQTSGAPYFQDDAITLWHGHAEDVIANLPAESVSAIVTSPPYFAQRDYDADGQIGQESTPAEYISALVHVFYQARQVLADDGTLWLNLGDSYAHKRPSGPQGSTGHRSGRRFTAASAGGDRTGGLPDKNLLGMPWRVALALQEDGWILRNAIVWEKTNAQPSSAPDRFTNRYEHVFLFSKEPSYYFDLDAVRVPNRRPLRPGEVGASNLGVNPGDVWSIATQPFDGAHFATMPVELAERCILSGTSPGQVVLDPFSGSGTTGLAATRHGRRYVGIDINRDYLDLSLQTRLAQPGLLLEGAGAGGGR